jgi:hypothetical protein
MGDVPDKAGHEMTVGARHRFSALDRAFRYQKALLRAYSKPILEIWIKRSITYVGPTRIFWNGRTPAKGSKPLKEVFDDEAQEFYGAVLNEKPCGCWRPHKSNRQISLES